MTNSWTIPEIIGLKRDGVELTKEQIETFIQGVVSKNVGDSQLGAFLMAAYLSGMTETETVHLTKSMMESGEVLNWPAEWKDITVDKHSTGGVGDKISLALAPALAANGLKVPMISGRGLGHSGGTLDKLESIPGFTVMLSPKQMIDTVRSVGCCIVGQTATLVPADRIMYAHRDVTGTVSSVPLICASIISKKAAETLGALILDVKVGKGAFMKSFEEARRLASNLVKVGNGLGVKTRAVLSRMDDPIGFAIGNAVEVTEALDCMRGNGPASLSKLVKTLGAQLLCSAGKCSSQEEGVDKIAEVLNNGQALETFRQMIRAQGVSEEVAAKLCGPNREEALEVLPKAKHATELRTLNQGYVASIDSLACAITCNNLGAGRTRAGEPVDHSVGMVLNVKTGDPVEKGSVWATIYHNQPMTPFQLESLDSALVVSESKQQLQDLILEVMTS